MKNDYHFRQSIDIKLVDKWLAEIEDKAFSIFEYSMQKMAREQEEERKNFFLFLTEEVNLFVINLIHDHQNNLQQIKFFLLASSQHLFKLFQKYTEHIHICLYKIKMLIKNINLLEHEHQDKFTIIFFEEYVYQMRKKLTKGLNLIELQVITLIDHLKIAYQVNATKDVIKNLLATLEVNSREIRQNEEKERNNLLAEVKIFQSLLST